MHRLPVKDLQQAHSLSERSQEIEGNTSVKPNTIMHLPLIRISGEAIAVRG